MAKAVKLADIAKQMGVSTVTVSKALSGQKGVSEDVRQKIKQLADELGYKRPSEAFREISEKKSLNIGVLIPEQHLDKYDSFYLQLYKQLTVKAVAKECFTLMEPVTQEMVSQKGLPKLIQEQKVDGIIVIGWIEESYLSFLSENVGVPLLFLDFSDEHLNVDSVISDSFYGAYYLTNYLFEMGHEKIAYVGTLLSTSSITDRYLGYMKSILEHGQQPRKEWQIDDRHISTAKIDADLMVFPEDMPTAFVCNCDLTASVLIKKLQENGYRVPEDVSVVGYDNFLFPGLCDIPITTYEVDTKEMARRAISILVKNICGESYRKGVFIVEGHLVVKESVRDLKA